MEFEAAVYRLRLRLGLVDLSEIVEWADYQISHSNLVSESILAIATLAKSERNKALSLLNELSSSVSDLAVLPKVLGDSAKQIRERPGLSPNLAKEMYQISVENKYEIPNDLSLIEWFDDAYSLAISAEHGTTNEVHQRLVGFANRFASTR